MINDIKLNSTFNNTNELLMEATCNNYTEIKKFNLLNEDKKNKMTDELMISLIATIMKKSKSLDFSLIDKSKGNINKFDNIKDLENCIIILTNLYQKERSKNPPMEILVLGQTLNNLRANIPLFTQSYNKKDQLSILLYETVVNSLVVATSYSISKFVDYVKNPLGAYELSFKKDFKTNKKILNVFSICEKFNYIAKKNELKRLTKFSEDVALVEDETIQEEKNKESLDKQTKNLKDAFGDKAVNLLLNIEELLHTKFKDYSKGTKAVIGIASVIGILFMLRKAVNLYYSRRHKFADYLDNMADFFELHLVTLDETNAKQKKTKEKQEKLVVKLRSWSKKIADDEETADKVSDKETDKQNKDIDLDDEGSFL